MGLKYIVLGLLLIVGVVKGNPEEPAEWLKTGTMQGVTVVFDVACDSESNVYAAIEISPPGASGASMGAADTGKVLKSTDDGMHWEPTGDIPNFNAKAVICLLITKDGTIYCGTTDRGDIGRVYKSENGGETWTSTGLIPNVDQSIYCLLEGKDGTIYAGGGYTQSKVWKSTNGGASWTLTGRLGGRSVRSLLELPDGTLYAGTVLGTGMVDTTTWVYKSTNKGQTWERVGEFPEPKVLVVFSMDYDERNDILYAGTGVVDTNYTPPISVPKVFKSFDKGNSWIGLNPISADAGETVRSIIKSDSGVLYIGTQWGITGNENRKGRAWIFKSTDDYHITESGRFGNISTSNGVSAIVQAPNGILYASITGPPAGVYKNTKEKIIGVEEKNPPYAQFTALPNPFTKDMEISYQLSTPAKVSLRIYNASGELVKTLIDELQPPGSYQTLWNGRDRREAPVPNGVYFFEFKTEKEREVRKVVRLF